MLLDLHEIDWSAISAIVSAVMAFLTYWIIRQNRDFKKAILVFEIKIDQYDFYIEITNVGESIATNLTLKLGNELHRIASGYSSVLISRIEQGKFTIKPHESKSLKIEGATVTVRLSEKHQSRDRETIYNYLEELGDTPIKIIGSYKTLGKRVKIDESSSINDFRITNH